MKKMILWYLSDWWKIMARPIYFYTYHERGDINDKPFSFMLVTGWAVSLAFTVGVYALAISQMMMSLIKGLFGIKLLIVLPVYTLLFLAFFIMIFLIILSVILVSFIFVSVITARVLDYIAKKMKGSGDVREMIRAAYYSTASYILFALLPLMAIASKMRLISYGNFVAGANITVSLVIFYLWGLWSIAMKKIYGLSRTKALIATLTVVVLMILLQMFVSVKILPKIERWIM